MNLEQLERLATAPMSPPPPRREPRPPRDGRVQESLDALCEELVWRSYDMLLNGDVLGRKADHDVSLEFATVVGESLRAGFDAYLNKGEEN